MTGNMLKPKKVGYIMQWAAAGLVALVGLALICVGYWSGALGILAGAVLLPPLKKPLRINTWVQIAICILLLFAALAMASPATNPDEVYTANFDTGEYVGRIANSKPANTGKLTYSKLGTYEGSFQNGKRNGSGVFTWKNGDVYTGEWKDDQINGSGAIAYSDGTKLTADFDNGSVTSGDYTWSDKNGSFTLHVDNSTSTPAYSLKADYANGISYSGEFSDGDLNGQGTMIYPKVGTYSGEFSAGKKSGEGKFTWSDGDMYSGTWSDDKMNGQGLYTFANGTTLSGNFKANAPQGTLSYTYQSKTYSTTWSGGKCTSIKKA